MNQVLLALVAVVFATAYARTPLHGIPNIVKSARDAHADIWAVLVAGSDTWDNYRHQADICHAYHILIDHGVPANRIIVLAKDDIANNYENPYPGKIFNKPDGPDVYAGCKIDYSGSYVTPKNFLAVMSGDSASVRGGNGRVVQSTNKDYLFVYFADHGAEGLIAFPYDILTANDLHTTMKKMYNNNRYAKFVFYLEACESGSMFSGILEDNINIYAITAANETESSWGCYCDVSNLPCLGDLFSVNWMEDSDVKDLTTYTLRQQFATVKQLTDRSEVKRYGDISISDEMTAAFQGWTKTNKKSSKKVTGVVKARDIPKLKHLKNPSKLHMFNIKRKYLESFMMDLVTDLVKDPKLQAKIMTKYLSRGITKLACHDMTVKAFHKGCFNFNKNPYAMEHAYVLANLCENGFSAAQIINAFSAKCESIKLSNIE